MGTSEDSKNGGKGFSLHVCYCKKPAFFGFPERKYLILTVLSLQKQSVDYFLFYLLKYSINGVVVSLSFISMVT